MDAVIIGGVRLDHVIATDGTWAGPVLGGNALYAAAAMHLWDRCVAVVSCINQQLKREALRPLAAAGIDIRAIVVRPGQEGLDTYLRQWPDGRSQGMTPREFRDATGAVLDRTGDDDLHRYGERYEQLHVDVSPTPADLPPDYNAARLFLLMTMPWLSHRSFVSYLASAAGAVLLDPYPTYMARATDTELEDLLQRVSIVLPSQAELKSRFGDLDPLTSARRLLAFGCGAVVVKLGAQGSLVVRRDQEVVAVPAYQTVAKDPTGAGDSFMGGFAAGLLETGDLVQAAIYGTAAASFAVEDFGLVRMLSIERTDVQRRLALVRRLVAAAI
jgi:sugar/nucleoside kinase (ribokinase family)